MALQVVAMEMAEALALNDEEQVLMGTRRTLSALALGGTRVLYRLLWALGYPEVARHGFRSVREQYTRRRWSRRTSRRRSKRGGRGSR